MKTLLMAFQTRESVLSCPLNLILAGANQALIRRLRNAYVQSSKTLQHIVGGECR